MDQKELELRAKLIREYKAELKGDSRMEELLEKVSPLSDEPVKAASAWEYGSLAGKHLEEAFLNDVRAIIASEDGYYAVKGALEAGYGDVASYTADVLTRINRTNGIGLHGQPAEFRKVTHTASAYANRISNAQTMEAAEKEIISTVRTFTNNAVGDTIRETADFQKSQGLNPKIDRTSSGASCRWCREMAGTYTYPCSREVFQRHANCDCVVEFIPGKGPRQILSSSRVRQNRKSMTPEERERQAEEIAELNRRKIAEDGHEIIDGATYGKLTRPFLRDGGIIIRGEDAARWLRDRATASYIAGEKIAFIRDDATVSDVLEEMYHAWQDRKHLFGTELNAETLCRREIDAQEYLISVAEKYKIPESERSVTSKNLDFYKKRLMKING